MMQEPVYGKVINKLFVTSLLLFIAAWLIPNLPWRPKKIENYLAIYKMIFEVFRTYSMISTATTTILIFVYFTVTGVYNWRRQYTQSTQNQKAEQNENKSENEQLWERIRGTKISKTKKNEIRPLKNEEGEIIKFMEEIKVFEYLELESLKQTLKGVVLKSVAKGEKLSLKKTDLVFVTFGSFKAIFIDPSSKANGLTVTCTRGRTLTSYSNVMRALAHHFNKTSDTEEELKYIKAIAKEDSQILILNAECFVRLANTSKLSVAHLTQVILSRFKRATIPIVFDYFNLTDFATSFLGYFIKKSPGFNNMKMSDLLNTQETAKSEEKMLKVILQYLIGSFDLNHTEFGSIESSLALLQSHIQIKSTMEAEIIQEIESECKGAFLVLEGKLKVSFSNEKNSKFIEASVGDFVGVISSLMGKCSSIQVNKVEVVQIIIFLFF